MTSRQARIRLGLILLAGAIFRFQGLNWDHNHHLHPDERFISMVDDKLVGGGGLSGYLDSATSKLNPFNQDFGAFVYGTLPLLLARAIGHVIGMRGYDGVYLVGRVLSGVFDLTTVWLVYHMVRRFADRRTALVGAGLLAFAPLAIQLSHFWTVDTFLTTFSAAAILASIRLAQGRRRPADLLLAGAAIGLAVSCKITGLSLLLPAGAAMLIAEAAAISDARREGRHPRIFAALGRLLVQTLVLLAAMAVTVRVAFPYAFLGRSPFSFRLDPRWVHAVRDLANMTRSAAGFPPNFQWAGRTFLYPIANIVLWGAGPFFGLLAFAALVWAVAGFARRRRLALAPPVLHALFLLAYHGLTMVKSIRYLYVAYPSLAVVAAVFAGAVARRAKEGRLPRFARFLPAALLAGTFLCGVAFTSIYRRENTRIAATRWIYAHVPAGQKIANETWDDGLPMPIPGNDPSEYSGPQIGMVGPDNTQKVEELIQALNQTDWIAITSNRAYGSLTRLPDVFPMSRAYYRALFEGRLGFDRIADFTSYPSLGKFTFADDLSDEAFTVYDHPRVQLFRKNRTFSPARTRAILSAAMPTTPPSLSDWEKLPRSARRVSAPLVPRRGLPPPPERSGSGPDSRLPGSFAAALLWYAAIFAAGVIALPLTWTLFPRLEERGTGFAKTIGLVAATYTLVAGVHARILPNSRAGVATGLFVLLVLSAVAAAVRRRELARFWFANRRLVFESEIVFLAGFVIFLAIRAFNPEIYWGEKPMDFSILNVLVRTRTIPAPDPWFSGAPLSYYSFGHEIVAALALLTGLSTRYAFNLAFGLLGGLILQGAFSLGRNWGRTRAAGVVAAITTLLLGNLSGPREWLLHKRALDWDYFWATSRVVKDTINEYPLWSLVFADLHAHVLAMPLVLLVLIAGLSFVRTHADPRSGARGRLGSAAVLGGAAAAIILTNAWDVPLLCGLIPVFAFVAAISYPGDRIRGAALAVLGAVAATAAAVLLAAPIWVRSGGMPGMGRSPEGAAGVDVLTVFGLFFLLAFGWALSAANEAMARRGLGRLARWAALAVAFAVLAVVGVRRIDALLVFGIFLFLIAAIALREEPGRRLALALISAGFFLVLYPQRFFIYDRMNTFFKLYLEAWLLFAVGCSILVFGRSENRGAVRRWPLPLKALALVAGAVAGFTAVTGVRGALERHYAAYSGPSLDGLRYLAESRPDEYRAVLWLRENVHGTPTILEAQGAPYQDFSRVSMLTGLPTVLGWEYHVKQRGNPESEIEARKEAIERIYKSPTSAGIEKLLRRYHVAYVYVGALERKTYCDHVRPDDPCRGAGAGLTKFEKDTDLFTRAYENGGVRIYRVAAADTEDVLTPVHETVELPSASGAPADEPEEPPAITEAPAADRAPWSGMREPRGASVDDRGRVWIADFGKNRLRIFNGDGGYLGGWGGRGAGTYQLREPCAVSVRGSEVYVADTWNGRVEKFSWTGEFQAIASGIFGPRGVAAGPDGSVWVADTGNHRVVLYDAALVEKKRIGKLGTASGDFSGPVGIAVGSNGMVYVADVGNRRIQVLDAAGNPKASWLFPGWKEWSEAHVAAGGGRVYASDPGANAVVAFDETGRPAERWTAGQGGHPFSRPTGLALDLRKGILYVVSSGDASVERISVSAAHAP